MLDDFKTKAKNNNKTFSRLARTTNVKQKNNNKQKQCQLHNDERSFIIANKNVENIQLP